ncbi:ferric reductase-like transmembrane domain-containing protein [Marimonas arenosa]|uniref:Ferric reductase-like transmembrane domain-containing protein n=1 Tax=Marimonas arenosa TaxID=1795305 RepID=A0AAE3WHF2_9RHOB|nr:ferric reductase-like transmembrane domain-containing protein [Marimonas arenosa]MDQ2091648.1 ferric reductase-like transmembrane domain-containing protein [Marimonas arenosa]
MTKVNRMLAGVVRGTLIWTALAIAIAVPIGAAAASQLIAWRQPVYIAGGFAGIFAMALLLLQPVLAAGLLPGLSRPRERWLHRWIGAVLAVAVVAHVAALLVTSPPDVVDALLFASPTPFSAWGVVAMWAMLATALLAVFRRRLRPNNWRRVHTMLATVIVVGSIVHALPIEGTMETMSKAALCLLVFLATLNALVFTRIWAPRTSSR